MSLDSGADIGRAAPRAQGSDRDSNMTHSSAWSLFGAELGDSGYPPLGGVGCEHLRRLPQIESFGMGSQCCDGLSALQLQHRGDCELRECEPRECEGHGGDEEAKAVEGGEGGTLPVSQ